MRNTVLFFLTVAISQLLNAQTIFPVLNIPVTKNQRILRQPWCGGLNSPQFTQGDLNGDGIPDLFAFDRNGDKPLVFLNNGSNSDTAFDYRPQYDNLFPEMVNNAQLRDYNHDSVPDLFAYTSSGTKVYKGIRTWNTVTWELVNPLLLYQANPDYASMFSLADDFSPFADVNNDGDIDFLTFGVSSTVQYFENQTVELGLPYDSLRFAAPVTCWGRFMEDAAVSTIHLISCKNDNTNEEERQEGSGEDPSRHAGGSSILALDNDADNDKDLIIGDFGWEGLTYLQNCGSNTYANMCLVDSLFPACDVPNDGIVFPTAFEVDADNDNLMDILVAPNPRSGTSDVKNINYYHNTGDTSCPYEFRSDSFLVSQMLDFGTDSKPAFFDYNSDGKLDILVGNYGYFRPFQTYLSELALLENTGTNTHPKFNLRDLNYSNLSQYLFIGIHPALGDLDGDGFKDLLIGELNGNLHLFKNPGTTTVSFPILTANKFMNLDVGQYSAPCIKDVNNDGLNDIVCGRKDGKISFFWNYGTSTNPQFSMDSANNFWGGINITASGTADGYSQPSIIQDSTGSKILYVGSNRGVIFKYLIDPSKLRGGNFNLVSNNALQFDMGIRSCATIADLNGDSKLDYIVGNSRGGLLFFSEALLDTSILLSANDISSDREVGKIDVFPNPVGNYLRLRVSNGIKIKTLKIYNPMGQSFMPDISLADDNSATINTSTLNNGLYVIVVNEQHSLTKKVLVMH